MFRLFTKAKGFYFLLVMTAFLASCSSLHYFPQGNVQKGLASWYGEEVQGNQTSSREIYNMYEMTAAHRTLPFGTYVRVTNLDNGRQAKVRINDRGPFVEGRVIDLSYAAARELDMVNQGVAPVRIEVLEKLSPKKSSQRFSVQVGAFISRENAEDLKDELEKNYHSVYISRVNTPRQTYFRVRIKAKDREASCIIAGCLAKKGYRTIALEEE